MKNVKKVQSWQVSEVELVYVNKMKSTERPVITSSKTAYDVLMEHWDKKKIDYIEHFKILLLDKANRVLAVYEVGSGGLTATFVDQRQVFCAGLLVKATAIILAHNHPSGRLVASNEDQTLTRKMVEAGKILDIQILDHIIVTSDGYYSFTDEGLI